MQVFHLTKGEKQGTKKITAIDFCHVLFYFWGPDMASVKFVFKYVFPQQMFFMESIQNFGEAQRTIKLSIFIRVTSPLTVKLLRRFIWYNVAVLNPRSVFE